MLRTTVELVHDRALNDLAVVHHHDAVAHVADDLEIVGDEEQRQLPARLQVEK